MISVFISCTQGPGLKKNYQINLKSSSGPINVLLVNKDSDNQSPVVVQVPPSDEGLASQCQAAAQEADQNVNPNQTTRPKGSKVSLHISFLAHQAIVVARSSSSSCKNFNVAHFSKSIKGINPRLGILAYHDKMQLQDNVIYKFIKLKRGMTPIL